MLDLAHLAAIAAVLDIHHQLAVMSLISTDPRALAWISVPAFWVWASHRAAAYT